MTASPRLLFGYNPPTGDRLLEPVNPRTYTKDLQAVLDVATQSFSSLWISDHHMTGDRFRLECWSVLMWVAARYPGPMLGTCVMANSYRHPPLLAKMAASLQYLSSGRLHLRVRGRLDRGRVPAPTATSIPQRGCASPS